MHEGLIPVTLVIAGVAGAATVLATLGRAGWLCELASHFRLQYAWVLLASTVVLIGGHQWLAAAVAASVAWTQIRLIAPFYSARGNRQAPHPSAPRELGQAGILAVEFHPLPTFPRTSRTFRVLLSNVLSTNRSYERLRCLIRDMNPDAAVFIETNEEWTAALAGLRTEYPFCKGEVLSGYFGILLFSRFPFEHAEVIRLGALELPLIAARLRLPDHRLTVIGAHPLSPISPGRARLRDQHLAELAEVVRRQSGPLMLVGDLNTTSWSPAFQDLLRTANLRDGRVGFGLQPTWPVAVPWLRIPIDHCLVSPEVVVRSYRRAPSIGSDHFPVVVDFSIA